jgi:biopolymer transport protein ExbD
MAVRLDHGKDELVETHEINVTPFIDVTLVLLVIFMVAAPLATVAIAVDLPKSTATPQPRPEKPLFLTVTADLALALGDTPVPRDALAFALDAASAGDKEQRIFLRVDKTVAYGDLMDVMGALRTAGYLKVALVGLEGSERRWPLRRFTMDGEGHVLAAQIERSSGHAAFDDEVLAMIKRSEPLPRIPPELERDQLELVVPLQFSLR